MASAKTKNGTRLPSLKVVENGASRDFHGEGKDLWLGIERRKYSYTIHIPERRSNQNRNVPESTIQNPKHHTKG
jgi:hypothetical protein